MCVILISLIIKDYKLPLSCEPTGAMRAFEIEIAKLWEGEDVKIGARRVTVAFMRSTHTHNSNHIK